MFTRLCFLLICYYFVRAYFAYSLLHFFARSNKQQLATNTNTHTAHTNKQTRTLNTLQQQLAYTNTHAKKTTRTKQTPKPDDKCNLAADLHWFLTTERFISFLCTHIHTYVQKYTCTYICMNVLPAIYFKLCLFRFGSAVYLLARLFSKYWEKNMRLGATIYLAPTSATLLPLLLLFTTCLSFSASLLSAVALYRSLSLHHHFCVWRSTPTFSRMRVCVSVLCLLMGVASGGHKALARSGVVK